MLVTQDFTQIPGVDYEETYSPVVDAITFQFLISLTITENFQMRLMDICMKVPEGFKMLEAFKSKPREIYSIKLK
jgi:hypothetical protein